MQSLFRNGLLTRWGARLHRKGRNPICCIPNSSQANEKKEKQTKNTEKGGRKKEGRKERRGEEKENLSEMSACPGRVLFQGFTIHLVTVSVNPRLGLPNLQNPEKSSNYALFHSAPPHCRVNGNDLSGQSMKSVATSERTVKLLSAALFHYCPTGGNKQVVDYGDCHGDYHGESVPWTALRIQLG